MDSSSFFFPLKLSFRGEAVFYLLTGIAFLFLLLLLFQILFFQISSLVVGIITGVAADISLPVKDKLKVRYPVQKVAVMGDQYIRSRGTPAGSLPAWSESAGPGHWWAHQKGGKFGFVRRMRIR